MKTIVSELQAHAPPHQLVAAPPRSMLSVGLRVMLIRPANSMPSVARPGDDHQMKKIMLARSCMLQTSITHCAVPPRAAPGPRPPVTRGVGTGRGAEQGLGRLLARPQGRVHGAVLDRLGRLAGKEHAVAERPRMIVVILGRAADAGIGIAAASTRGRSASADRARPPAPGPCCGRTSCAASDMRHLLHLLVVALAVEAHGGVRHWRSSAGSAVRSPRRG